MARPEEVQLASALVVVEEPAGPELQEGSPKSPLLEQWAQQSEVPESSARMMYQHIVEMELLVSRAESPPLAMAAMS